MATRKETKKERKKSAVPEIKSKMTSDQEQYVVNWILSMRDEAEEAKQDRMHLNRDNFDIYHLRHNFDHKEEGQSTEVLSKQAMAVEQISSFFQQALVDVGEWFRVESDNQETEGQLRIKPHEIEKVLARQLEKANFFSHVGLGVKSGLLGALTITKVNGKMISKPKFRTQKEGKGKNLTKKVVKIEDKTWQLTVDLVRQENYYPDPTGDGLYENEDMWMDLYKVKALAKGDRAIYSKSATDRLTIQNSDNDERETNKSRETGQSETHSGRRGRLKITEYWGDILDEEGSILYENIVATIANDKELIRKPTPNPLWHQQNPYTIGSFIEVPHAVWPKALMDAPTRHNIALVEIYNLILDGAMKAVNGISQIRVDHLKDKSQVSDGLKPGTALQVKNSLPPGTKVAEPVITADVPRDGLEVMNVVQQEFNASALTSDLRAGVQPFRQQKATAIVEQSQTITSIFQGVAKNIEAKWIQPTLEKAWMTIAQNWQDISLEELESLFGSDRAAQLKTLDPQDIFTDTVNGVKFRVFGISLTLSKQEDFRKLTQLLQTVGSSEILIEEFSKKFDFGKLLGEIMTSLNLDKHKIEISEQEAAAEVAATQQQEGGAQPTVQPTGLEQVPQAGAGSLSDIFATPQFPGSPATARGQ